MSECSDPDEWMQLHHGEPGTGLYLEGGEESEAVSDESQVPTDNDTLYSEFMQAEYVEWPAYDFSGSHDRAQLSAYQQIQNYSERQAQAIRDNHERVADWCNEQMQVHRVFSRVGSLSLNR